MKTKIQHIKQIAADKKKPNGKQHDSSKQNESKKRPKVNVIDCL